MPSCGRPRQLLLEVSHGGRTSRGTLRLVALLALIFALGACTSSATQPAKSPSAGTPGNVSERPATVHSVRIYLCAKVSAAKNCTGRATAGQTAALRSRLQADSDVQAIRYLSERNVYLLARKTLSGRIRDELRPGDLGAIFRFTVASAADASVVVRRYSGVAGAAAVKPCRAAC